MAQYCKNFIVRAVCVLLLLSYTSIALTSFQLLKPLIWMMLKVHSLILQHTYQKCSSGRHAFYGTVAVVCLTIFVVGFPALLLLFRSKFNFVKIKSLLDQFQGSYKDKYHWFIAYYLMCRLVIFLISYLNIVTDSIACTRPVSL